MLAYLTVRNFALVADLELRFVEGLTVITGESGAGKSILLEALGLVLGQRASKSQIRPNTQECEVTAEFDLTNAPQSQYLLGSQDLLDPHDPTQCVVRRNATIDGRSRAWVNAAPVSLGVLRELCGTMVAAHGQFSQQQLLVSTAQLAWFDDFVAHPDLVAQVRQQFHAWRTRRNEFEKEKQRVAEARERSELLQYQVNELDEFALQEKEFEELSTRFKRLSQTQSILSYIAQTVDLLDESSAPSIGRARSALDRVDDTSVELSAVRELLESAEVGIEECLHLLRNYVEALAAEEGSLDDVSLRLDRIHELARKHRVPSAELFGKTIQLHQELDALGERESNLSVLARALDEAHNAYLKCSNHLSLKRSKAVKPFTKAVQHKLGEIGMKQARFNISFSETTSETGLERVDFTVSANSRYALGPLKLIASGGELSRISLAILAVVASHSKLPCLVLDEADIGVGGTTADEVGRMLRQLATYTQVVCVTHAPQVAALGDAHLRVSKTNTQDIAACELLGAARVEEIARMVGGHRVNAESRTYARVLLKEAQEINQLQTS